VKKIIDKTKKYSGEKAILSVPFSFVDFQSRGDTDLDVVNDSLSVDGVCDELKCEWVVALYAHAVSLAQKRMILG
jgi:hypothetical protein